MTTPHRNYPVPAEARTVAEEFPITRQAMLMVDGDVHALFQAVAALPPVTHVWGMGNVAGLTAALAEKLDATHQFAWDDMTDVSGMSGAAVGMIPQKTAMGWQPSSVAAAVGAIVEGLVNGQLTTINGNIDARVRFDAAQTLTAPQKAQARANVGLGTAATRNIFVSATEPSGAVEGDIWIVI